MSGRSSTDSRTYGLTTRAAELLAVLRAFKARHGRTPTYNEMAADLGVAAKSTIHRLLTQLEDRGLVRRLYHRHQSVELIELRAVSLPADLHARLTEDANLCGRDVSDHLADAVRAFLPSPSGAARERELSTSPTPF